MDRQTNGRDLKLLQRDRYTFAVLSRILNGPCRLILTDHERLIICHSADPFPVWIWTADDLSAEEKERAWRAVAQTCPMTDGYRYNLKYDLAEFFLSKAKKQGIHAEIITNMLAYDCPNPVAPNTVAGGHVHRCTWEDREEAAAIYQMFHEELDFDRQDGEYLKKAEEKIAGNRLFFWKDSSGRTVSGCSCTPIGELTSIGGVYTIPAYRRNHYAENLVYQVTRMIKEAGAMPMLYTDADYAASNACYQKIGYVLRGKLCTVGVKPCGAADGSEI